LKDLVRVREGLAGQKRQAVDVVLTAAPSASAPSAPTLALASPWRRRLLYALAGLSVLLAAVVGLAVGRSRSRATGTPSPDQPAPVASDVEVGALFSLAKREEFLKQAMQQYANPGLDPQLKKQGIRHALELGKMYLDQWRLTDADFFFSGLINN